MTAQLTFADVSHGDKAARDASDLLARACLRVHEVRPSSRADEMGRLLAAHALMMLAIGLANHPRSFAGLTFDERGIAEWK